ncbi:4'-phosphopantetheinyl transferase superfamily protein [Staphylococcus pseudintermedius]|nr:4'-phosphopantetheinyl transferase superfamily protein [Staphylococcus pseudintermedius]
MNNNKNITNNRKIGDLLVQYSLFSYFGLKPHTWIAMCNQFNQPLVLSTKKFFYSKSYSKDKIICVVDNEPIGVDIEYLDESIQISCIMKQFHEEEQKFIKDSKKQLESFYLIWTLKESYLKLKGIGLNLPLNYFNVCQGVIHDRNINMYKKSIRHDNFLISVCKYNEIKKLEIKIVKLNDLKNFIKGVYRDEL